MDVLAGFLDGPRARGAFLLRSILDPPWSLRVEDRAPLTLVAMVRGDAWITSEVGETVLVATDSASGAGGFEAKSVAIGPGDVALVRGPNPYVVADNPATPPQVVIHPGQRCTTLYGEDLSQAMDLGVRTWGNNPEGAAVLLTGTYEEANEVSQRLLDALPGLLLVSSDTWDSPLVGLLADEIVKDEPGQSAVLDRLLDLLLIAVLRAWFSRPEAEAPAWYRAQTDPVVGRAMRMLQNNPAHPWTVASLAAEIGVSRAALARRFADLVGEPPMTYLTEWRLALAADLLREPDATVGGVAREVGYSTPFALSTAFKRVRGISPQEHRLATIDGHGR